MNYAVILLAGLGKRFGGDTPKQFQVVSGHPLCYYSINAFQKSSLIDEIILVSQREHYNELASIVQNNGFNKVKSVVVGGQSRQESSRNALEYLHTIAQDDDIILIHDGARPLVSEEIIEANVICAKENGACITAIPSADTIAKSVDGKSVEEFLERKSAFLVQTPQSFKLKIIYEAHAKSPIEMNATDDSQLVRQNGQDVSLVLGNKELQKVTTADDLAIIETYIKRGNY